MCENARLCDWEAAENYFSNDQFSVAVSVSVSVRFEFKFHVEVGLGYRMPNIVL